MNKKPINEIRVEDYIQQDFANWESEDLFEVTRYYEAYVNDAKKKGYYIYGQPVSSSPGPRFTVYDFNQKREREFINFCSYNYCGFSYHPEVLKASKKALDQYGAGAVSAPLLSGTYDVTINLENKIAEFKQKDAAIIFSSGYGTNLGTIQALMRPGDVVVMDMLAHASIVDGAKLSGADMKFFRHNSPKHLDRLLSGLKTKRVLVCFEGVYSMDGDIAPVDEIVEVCKKHNVKTLIDEAHSTLVFGEKGRGVAEHFGVEQDIDLHIGTFSKSFGGIGGFCAANSEIIIYLKYYARSFLFSCGISPVMSAGLLKALEIYQNDPTIKERIWENSAYMKKKLDDSGFDTLDSKSQVIPVIAGKDSELREASVRMQDKGLFLGAITYPAVPKNKTRFRISVSSEHTKKDIDDAVDIMIQVYKDMGKF